jgi:hypothetical protein
LVLAAADWQELGRDLPKVANLSGGRFPKSSWPRDKPRTTQDRPGPGGLYS